MNEEKFTGKADIYDKYRPSYPDGLIRYLYGMTHLREYNAENVIDIGAGTGKLTACLATKPWKITAVEPNGDMLEKLKQNFPDITTVKASAENTGLPDNSADLITVAQAFHWFEKDKFKAECKRLLKENGRLAIIWNERCHEGISKERDEICLRFCPAYRSGHVITGTEIQSSAKTDDDYLVNEFFENCLVFKTENNIPMTMEHFIGDTLSRSYALCECDENYNEFIKALKSVFNKYEKDGTVILPYVTSCYFGTL